MSKPLTAAACLKLRPGAVRREIKDSTPGLYLVLQPSGHRSFCLRFRGPDSKPQKISLGPFDASAREADGSPPTIGAPLSLAAARQLATELLRQRAMGTDLVAERRAERHRPAGLTFSDAAVRFFEE